MSRKRQVTGVVAALIKVADDQTPKVSKTVIDSLFDIGRHEAEEVLSQCNEALKAPQKIPRSHRIALLTVIHRVLDVKLQEVPEALGLDIGQTAIKDLTEDKEVVPDWQGKASSVLVTLSTRFPKKITDDLLTHFGPGVVPHYFVMKTLGDMAIGNPLGMVPLVNDILSRMLPVLASIKADNMRWVFATAIGHFCDAINHYKVDAAGRGDAFDLSVFAPQVFSAYELMFVNWLPSKELKVRLATIQAIGVITTILNAQQLEQQLLKIVGTLNGMYLKETYDNHSPITQAYRDLLLVATQEALHPLWDEQKDKKSLLDTVLGTIFPLSCKPVDFSQPNSLKNNNELLRSIEILAKAFIDRVLAFLFQKLEAKDATVRTGAIVVVKHLVTRIQKILEDRKELIISALKPLALNETVLECKKALSQVIIAMANENYLKLEGGEKLIEFIILNSSISDAEIERWQATNAKKASKDQESTSPSELRSMCDHVLTLMTETMPQMVDVLWPFLLEPLTKPEFSGSLAVLAKSIAHISKIKRSSGASNYMVNFERNLNVPKPQEIMARLFVLLHLPNRRGSLGLNLLNSLLNIGPILHPSVVALWDATLPKMIVFLEGLPPADSLAQERENQNKWAGLVRRLLAETVKAINDDVWVMTLGDAILAQFPLHGDDHGAKQVAFKLLGSILQQINHKEYIRTQLTAMFTTCDHSNDDERHGCAQGFGYAAASHLDAVLDQLTSIIKPEGGAPKKEKKEEGGGFFASLFGGGGDSKAKPKASGGTTNTVLLSYGYISANAKPSLLPSRLELHIINNMNAHFTTTDPNLRLTLVQTIDLIGQAVNPSHLGTSFAFKSRDDFMRHLFAFLNLRPLPKPQGAKEGDKAPPAKPPAPHQDPIPLSEHQIKLAVLAFNACSTLMMLDPPLPGDIEEDLLLIASQYYTAVKQEPPKPKEGEKAPPLPGTSSSEDANCDLIYENYDRALGVLLTHDPSIGTLERVLTSLAPFVRSRDPLHRQRALNTYAKCLKKLIEIISAAQKARDRLIPALGTLVSQLLPRAIDPVTPVRGLAVESMQLLFYLHWLLGQLFIAAEAGKTAELSPPKTLTPFTGLRKRLVATEDVNEHYALAQSLASLLSGVVEADQLPSLVKGAVVSLGDQQPTAARGTCVVLFGLANARAADLKGHIIPIVTDLINKMQTISNEATLNGSLHALRTLAKTHLDDTVEALLRQPVPHPPHVVRVLQLLARDADLIVPMVKHLTEVLNNGDLMENEGADAAAAATKGAGSPAKSPPPSKEGQAMGGPPKKRCTPESMGATVCLAEILSEDEIDEVVQRHFALFFGTLLLRIGTTAGLDPPDASQQVVNCWKNFFNVLEEDDVMEGLQDKGFIAKMSGADSFVESAAALTGVVCKRHPAERRGIFKFLLPAIKANYDGQRLAAAFAAAEMVNHSADDASLLDQLVNQLLSALVDPKLTIASLRGLGNIVACSPENINHYAASIVDALMASIDAPRDPVSLEAMNSLAKLFAAVEEARIAPVLINVCHRIRPAFDHPNPFIRIAAADLFGTLARFGDSASKSRAILVEQIHNNLPCLIVHINDEHTKVQAAFRRALFKTGPLLQNQGLTTILTTPHIFSPDMDTDFQEFVFMHLSKALISAFPEHLNGYIQLCIDPYFKSQWDGIKANAAYFIGSVLGHLPEDLRKTTGINPGLTAKALIELLSSPSPLVRAKAAESLSMLHSY